MSETEYTYSISTDFPNGKVASSRLEQEIRSSAIVTALDRIDTVGDSCDVWFKDALSVGDQAILDDIVAEHTGEPLPDGPTPVKQVDTEGLDPDVAENCTEGVDIDVESGVNPTVKNLSYPFPIDAVACRYVFDNDEWEHGDKFDAFGISAGDPAIGAVTSPVSIDDTVINVSPTVFQYLRAGYFVKFQDGDEEYRVGALDEVAGTITLLSAITEAVSAGKTIHPRRPFAFNIRVHKNILYPVGDLTAGSSIMDTGSILRIRYYHKTDPTSNYQIACDLIQYF